MKIISIIENGFSGINILNMKINISKERVTFFKSQGLLEQFEIEKIYTIFIKENNEFKEIRNQLINDEVEIKNLIGINGEIYAMEYKNKLKIT